MLQGIVGAETHSARGPGGNDLGCSSGSSNCLPWLFNNTMKIIVGQQQIHEPSHFSALETAWGTRYETNMKENIHCFFGRKGGLRYINNMDERVTERITGLLPCTTCLLSSFRSSSLIALQRPQHSHLLSRSPSLPHPPYC